MSDLPSSGLRAAPTTITHLPEAPAERVFLSVIIPMYRERERIDATIADVIPWLESQPRASELILIDDGSDDDTSRVALESLRGAGPGALDRTTIARHPVNRGKGAAVRTGFGLATGEWVLFMDADNSTPVSEVTKLLAAATSPEIGLVIGSRQTPDAEVEAAPHRRLAGAVFRSALGLLGLSLASDTQCGFKLYRRGVAAHMAGLAAEDRFAFDIEHLAIARRDGIDVREVGVAWTHAAGGTVNVLSDGPRTLRSALAIKRRLAAQRPHRYVPPVEAPEIVVNTPPVPHPPPAVAAGSRR